jgi:hypothetical protein
MVRSLPEVSWRIMAGGAALAMIRVQYSHLLPLCLPARSPVQAEREDLAGARAILAQCAEAFETWKPDFVVRTTPSTGIGTDELIATAVAGRVPVLCLQDFPGLGVALCAGEHSLVSRSCDVVATVDEPSAEWISSLKGLPAHVVGWCAHDRFRAFPPYADARRVIRGVTGLAEEFALLVLGASEDVAEEDEADLLAAVARLTVWDGAHRRSGPRFRPHYRPHPRRSPSAVQRLMHTFEESVGAASVSMPDEASPGELYAWADIVASHASAVNLEVMAYAALSQGLVREPLSIYLEISSSKLLFDGYWGPTAPSTHMPGNGSLLTDPDSFPDLVLRMCEDDELWRRTSALGRRYAPAVGDVSAISPLRDLVERWVR